ncbi:MAG: putative PEP-CTERM system TPR-repeat lipoprotein [Gammaproteobacteria bacterium]
MQLRRARQEGADENLVAVPISNSLLSQEKYEDLKNYISRARRSPEVDSKLLVIMGIAYTQQQKYEEAEQAFKNARNLDPENPEPLLAQASLALNKDDLDTVQKLVALLHEIAPNSPDFWLLEGDLHLRQNNPDLALSSYDRILKVNPDYVTAKLRRSRILLNKGQFETVITELKPLWENGLSEPEAIYLYAMALARSDKTALATRVLEEASQRIDYLGTNLVDKHPTLALLSATIAYSQGDQLKALEGAKKLIDKLPNHAESRMLLARIYTNLEQAEDVINTLKPIYYRQENNPEYLSLYGRALIKQRKYPEAIELLERAASITNNPKPFLTDIALAKIAMGNTNGAIEDLETAVKNGDYDIKSAVLLAYTQLSQGNKLDARSTAELLLKQAPENPVLHNLLGTIAAAEGETKAARQSFHEALKFDPAYTSARLNLIKFDLKDGDLDKAKRQLEQLLLEDPDSREAMAGLAQIAERHGDFEASALWLEKLWAKNPEVLMEVLHLVDIYQQLGQEEKALNVAHRLRDKHPRNFDVLVAEVNTLLVAGKRQEAIDSVNLSLRYTVDFSVRQLLEIAKKQVLLEDTDGAYSTLSKCLIQEPDYIPAKIELIKLETQLRNYDKALTLANQVIINQPDSALGHSLRGDILVYAGRENEALEVYEKINAIWPSTQLHLKILQLQPSNKKSGQTLIPLEKWVQKNPNDVEAQYGLAVAYINVNELDKAIELHQSLLKKLPNDASVHNNLAWLLQHKKDTKALQHAKKAYALSPQDPAILDTYGWVLSETGQSETGLRYIREALSRASNDPSTLYHLALVLNRMERKDEARDTLEKLLKNNLDFREIEEAKLLLAQLTK